MNHKHLLNVLSDFGFRGPVQEVMSSYLSNRSQRVRIGNQLSAWKIVGVGVPQGSVLVPLIVILCITEITKISSGLDLTLFADDTVLLQNKTN